MREFYRMQFSSLGLVFSGRPGGGGAGAGQGDFCSVHLGEGRCCYYHVWFGLCVLHLTVTSSGEFHRYSEF